MAEWRVPAGLRNETGFEGRKALYKSVRVDEKKR